MTNITVLLLWEAFGDGRKKIQNIKRFKFKVMAARVVHQWGFHEMPPVLGEQERDGRWFHLLGSLCSTGWCWVLIGIFPGCLSCATLRTVFVLPSRAVSPSYADSQTLLTHRGEPGDPEMWDVAPSTEVRHSASILLLQKRRGFGVRLE